MSKKVWYGLLMAWFMLTACNNGMEDQPKYEPFEASILFDNGTSAQPLLVNTVARGQLQADTHQYAGQSDGGLAAAFPFTVTLEVLARGQQRYDIYCSLCHGLSGYGDGIVVQRGLTPPPSFHDERLRAAPVGHFFDVITNGFGAMYSYGDRVAPQDRWAIAAYIRALQLSQNATVAELPTALQDELENAPDVEPAGQASPAPREETVEAEADE